MGDYSLNEIGKLSFPQMEYNVEKLHLTIHELYDRVRKFHPEFNAGSVWENKRRNYELLFLSKSENVSIKGIDELLKGGADINYVDPYRDSILHHVVHNSRATLEVIQFILESGAFPDARNRNNEPPLAYCKQLSVAKLLIQYTVTTKLYQNTSNENSDFYNENRFTGESDRILDLHFCRDVDNYTFFRNYRDSCISEMKLMRKDMIAKDYTFFDFITRNYLKEDKKVDKFIIVEIVSRLLDKKYPSCRDIIYAIIQHCDGIDLTRLFNVQICSVNPLVANPVKKVIFLNAECTAEVENNLTAEDTVNLIQAFGRNNVFKRKLCSSKRLRAQSEQISVKKLHVSEN